MKYFISDWAGNSKLEYYGTFDSVEDAIDRLWEEFDNEIDVGEFQINEMPGAK